MSQKLPRDSGETIFAARHQSVSQGPLGKDFRGSASIGNPCFFGGFPCRFPKRQGKEDQGPYPHSLSGWQFTPLIK